MATAKIKTFLEEQIDSSENVSQHQTYSPAKLHPLEWLLVHQAYTNPEPQRIGWPQQQAIIQSYRYPK